MSQIKYKMCQKRLNKVTWAKGKRQENLQQHYKVINLKQGVGTKHVGQQKSLRW